MSKFKRRPSAPTVISLLALFVALGGTATAARLVIKNTKQIRAGAVTSSDIKDGTVKSKDLGNNLQESLAPATGGDALGGGKVFEALRPEGPSDVAAKNAARVLTLDNIPRGSYAFFGKATLAAEPQGGLLGQGASAGGHCAMHVQSGNLDNADDARNFLASPGANTPGTVNMQITATLEAPAQAYIDCDVTGAPWSAANSSIIAVPVPVGPRQIVDG